MRIIALAVAFTLLAPQPDPDVIWFATVHHQNTYDSQNIQFFELRKGAEAPLISLQGNSELARFLRRQDGKRIAVTFSVVDLNK